MQMPTLCGVSIPPLLSRPKPPDLCSGPVTCAVFADDTNSSTELLLQVARVCR